MFTKRFKQKTSLALASTLMAGVFSIITSTTGSAATADATASTLWLASTNSTTGAPVVTAAGGDTALDKSTGFIAITSAASATQVVQGIGSGLASGVVGTAVATPTSSLTFNAAGGAITEAVSINVSGGTIAAGATVATMASTNVQLTGNVATVTVAGHGLSAGQVVTVDTATAAFDGTFTIASVPTANTFTYAKTNADIGSTAEAGVVTPARTYDGLTTVVRSPGKNPVLAAAISPTGAAGTTMTVSAYKGASVTASTPTNGTLLGQWVITIAASGTAGIFNAGESSVATQAQVAKGTACATTNAAYDDVSSIRNNYVACILVNPKDVYGTAVTTGTVSASATNSAKVLVSAANAAAGYLAAAPFSSATSAANLYVAVTQPTANVGGSTVVTISWNGVVIGTKTITFQGDVAKLTLLTTGATNSNTVYLNGATNSAPAGAVGKIFYSATDALGQAVTLTAAPVISDATGAMAPAVLSAGADAAAQTLQIAANGFGFATMTIAANPLLGAGTYRLKVTNAAGADIKSDVINATVVGGAATFTASWDKAQYSPGETATLTISAKDSGGRPVAQGVAITGGVLTVNSDGLTSQTCPADISTTTFNKADGSRVCTFAVKNTAGSYSYSMALTNSTGQSAVTGSVKIVSSDVSNAEVLKSIVALIASINKQIAALQKLILKR